MHAVHSAKRINSLMWLLWWCGA